jgi:hypothetical protein
MNYVTIDKEHLCVVATLRKFCSMLPGAKLHIHTDHKNILIIGDSSQQRLRWIFYVDEYGPEINYVESSLNVIADTFSRLSHGNVSSPSVGKKATNVVSNSESNNRNESSYPEWYSSKTIKDVEDILYYTKPGDKPANWKVALTQDLINSTIKWYH